MYTELHRRADQIAGQLLLAGLKAGSVSESARQLIGDENDVEIATLERMVRNIANELLERAESGPKPTSRQIEKKLEKLGFKLACNKRGKVKYSADNGYGTNYPAGSTVHLPGGSIMAAERWREHYDYYRIFDGSDIYIFNTWEQINTWADEREKARKS